MKIEFKNDKGKSKKKKEKSEKIEETIKPQIAVETDVVETNESDLELYKPSLKKTKQQSEDQIEDIGKRIQELEVRIDKFKIQEKMLNEMIEETMERISQMKDPMQFKKKSQLQNIYFRQLEIQGQLVDSIMKYESTLQTYLKMRTDTTNSYFRNYKALSDVSVNDSNVSALETLLSGFNDMINNKTEVVALAELELEKEEEEGR